MPPRPRPRPARSAGAGSGSGTSAVLKFRNRTMTIFRGTAIGYYGEEDDIGVVFATGIPAALAETSEVTEDRTEPTRRTVRTFTLVFDSWVDVTLDDTLQDESTGYFFEIQSMQERPGIGMYPPAKILTITMRSGISVASDG